ncbi:hypothetical protein ACWCP8_34860 [Streptomyces sp. NPDC002206]
MDSGGQGAGGEAGPLVRGRGPVAGQRAQHGLVLGVARVQRVEVGGHHPAAGRAGVVVDGRLHDLFVQAGLVRSAAQDVGEVAAGFGEQVPALERAAHHVHHGDSVDGGQGDVDNRPRPRPHRCGCRPRPLCQLVDGAGAERPDRRLPSAVAQFGQRSRRLALRRARPVCGLLVQRVGGPLPRRVPLPLLVVGHEDGQLVGDLLTAGGLPADQPLVDARDLHDRPPAGRHLSRLHAHPSRAETSSMKVRV